MHSRVSPALVPPLRWVLWVIPAFLVPKPELTQPTGPFHAGAIIALAGETVTAAAMGKTSPTGEFRPELLPLTRQMFANWIRTTNQGTRVAEAGIVHRGRTTMAADWPGR
jgi:acyl-coenzyme A thioesterase PaaI-like protein